MPLDPAIYSAFAQRPVSALDTLQQLSGIDNTRGINALQQLQMQQGQGQLQDAQQARGERNALAQLLSNPTFNRAAPDAQQQLYRTAPTQAAGIIKSWQDQDKTTADIGKIKAETVGATAKAQKDFGSAQADVLKSYRGALDFIDTPQGAQRWLQAQYADPLLSSHMQALGPLEQAVTRIPQDPGGFEQWRQKAGLGMDGWLKQQLEQQKAGETGRHNSATENLTAQGQAVTMRGQNMTDARSREANTIQKDAARTQIINDPVQGPLLIDKGNGNTRRAMMDGSPVPGKEVASERKNSSEVLKLLDQADSLLSGATGSYAGAAYDQTARFVGAAPDGAVKIGQLKAVEGALISKMPRMEGPQSDADRLLYQQSAGQIGDPTVPAAMKKAALGTVREIQKRYAGQAPAAATDGLPADIADLLKKHR